MGSRREPYKEEKKEKGEKTQGKRTKPE